MPPGMQINQLTKSGHPLIKVVGTVAGHPAICLFDCGATGQFASSRYAQAHGLTVTSGSSDTITLADGRSQPAAGVLSSVLVSFGSYSDRLDFTVTDLHGYDVILGMPWLVRYNPVIDWRGATVSFVDQHGRLQVLRRAPTGVAPWRDSLSSSSSPSPSSRPLSSRSSFRPSSTELNLITAKQLERHRRKGLIEFACLVYPQLVAESVRSKSVVSSITADAILPVTAQTRCQSLPDRSYAHVVSSVHPGHTLSALVAHSSYPGGSLSSSRSPLPGSPAPTVSPTGRTCQTGPSRPDTLRWSTRHPVRTPGALSGNGLRVAASVSPFAPMPSDGPGRQATQRTR